jgi:3-phenylpropionate/trans-cinnamate dioxygenase ferredoxin reductase subunit
MRDPESTIDESTVVAGAGQAGFSFCSKLRELGYQGSITLVGDEAHLPYQRPPLSKAYMHGGLSADRLLLRPKEFYEDQGIDVISGLSITGIELKSKSVTLSDNSRLGYDTLILATGSKPRKLPPSVSSNLSGIYYLRDLADADAIASEFRPGAKGLVIGGGYIGLEAAATTTKHGVRVTLIEAAGRILQRVACRETSGYFRDLHTSHGVKIREGVGLTGLTGSGGKVSGAELRDGSILEIDFVLVGIGVIPNQELAEAAGIICSNGIEVDATCRTSEQGILAIGDCASFPYEGHHIRLESVGHAIDHAQAAAAVVMGSDKPYKARPWFWSDQYDIKLQIAGLSSGFDQVVIRGGDKASRSHWYFEGNRLLAVDAMNEPRAYMVGKRMIDAGRSPSIEAIEDESLDLKSLLKI